MRLCYQHTARERVVCCAFACPWESWRLAQAMRSQIARSTSQIAHKPQEQASGHAAHALPLWQTQRCRRCQGAQWDGGRLRRTGLRRRGTDRSERILVRLSTSRYRAVRQRERSQHGIALRAVPAAADQRATTRWRQGIGMAHLIDERVMHRERRFTRWRVRHSTAECQANGVDRLSRGVQDTSKLRRTRRTAGGGAF